MPRKQKPTGISRITKFWRDHIYRCERHIEKMIDTHNPSGVITAESIGARPITCTEPESPEMDLLRQAFPRQSRPFADYTRAGLVIQSIEHDGVVPGFILMCTRPFRSRENFYHTMQVEPGMGYSFNMFVDPAHRQSRYARIIVTEQTLWARENGFRYIRGYTREQDKAIRRMYQHHGYKLNGGYADVHFAFHQLLHVNRVLGTTEILQHDAA